MRFLVISTPRYQVPVEKLPGLLAAERAWYDRNRECLGAYGWFAEGGGFGLVDVPDVESSAASTWSIRSSRARRRRSARSSTPTSPSSRSARCSSSRESPFLPRLKTGVSAERPRPPSLREPALRRSQRASGDRRL
jgi:hypothetical protein